MTHLEKRSSASREYLIAVFTGGLYGAVHTISGHPLDTVKTRMQLDRGYFGVGTYGAIAKLWKTEGIRGFTRGMTAPLMGSTGYRSVMISTFELTYTYMEVTSKTNGHTRDAWTEPLPYTCGAIRPSVVVSTLCASIARSLVEGPFEYAKVMYQTKRGGNIRVRDIFRGQGMQTLRTTSMLLFIYLPFDYIRRETRLLQPAPGDPLDPHGLPNMSTWLSAILRQGLVTMSICGAAYTIIWPLETMKNVTQAGMPYPKATTYERLNYLSGGNGFQVRSLFRGALPGIISGGFRNGCAAIAMGSANRFVTASGWRE